MKPNFLLKISQQRRACIPYFVLVIALLLTVAITNYVRLTARAKDRLRFQNLVNSTQNDMENRLDTYIALLRATSGLFAANNEQVSREQFHAFVNRLKIQQHSPGIQGIGFSIRVNSAEIPALVANMKKQGVENFNIRPNFGRKEYHSIIYLEPLDRRNQAAIGYDMFTSTVRRAAMESARDTGTPAASGKVTLVQEIDQDKQAGFLIYVPVYKNSVPATVTERRATLLGFVYSPFRVNDLMQGIFGREQQPFVDLEIYDGTQITLNNLFYSGHISSVVDESSDKPSFKTTKIIDVAGRSWSIVFTSRPEFDRTSPKDMIPYIAFAGLGISFVLFGVTRSLVNALDESEQATQEREKLLVREQIARADAEAANRMKDEFLATLSHELRTPLHAIFGWTQLLRSRKFDETTTAKALETIERNTKSLTILIDDVLDVSRIITGKLHLEIRSVEIVSLVEAAIDAIRPAAIAKEIDLSLEIPELSEDNENSKFVILCDANRLQQVIWNLLSNAVKFTPREGRVYVQMECINSYVQIRVSDTGEGIASDFLPYVFDRFRQADSSTTRPHAGLGLGLAIVRHLVELHGGTVSVSSPGVGLGATFTVNLPIANVRNLEQSRDGKLPRTHLI